MLVEIYLLNANYMQTYNLIWFIIYYQTLPIYQNFAHYILISFNLFNLDSNIRILAGLLLHVQNIQNIWILYLDLKYYCNLEFKIRI